MAENVHFFQNKHTYPNTLVLSESKTATPEVSVTLDTTSVSYVKLTD